MRLTLRTLLSWLDDMLPANEVRAIGHQVNESTFARELVDRIRKVTRQRRLSVPGATGADHVDPNLVADYLDNVMPAEKVAEYERLCLKSDVHLAEAASVHQVLSLLGQRAKVPPDAKYRMYHLIHGNEAAGERARRPEVQVKPEPVAAEVPTWRPEPQRREGWGGRMRPFAILAGLLLVLGWTGWENLRPRRMSEDVISSAVPASTAADVVKRLRDKPDAAVPGVLAKAASGEPGMARPPALIAPIEANPGMAAAEVAAEGGRIEAKDGAVEPVAVAPAEVMPPGPVGVAGTVAPAPGILVEKPDEETPWRRLQAGSPLTPGATLLGLEPFRSTLQFGPLSLQVVERARLRVLDAADGASKGAISLALDEGRIVARPQDKPALLNLNLGDGAIELGLAAGVPVGLERPRVWQSGQAKASEPGLLVFLTEGDLSVNSGGASRTVTGPATLAFSSTGELRERIDEPPPNWVIEPTPPIDREEAGRQLLRFFKPDKPPLTSLVEASTSDSEELRRYAFEALGALGQYPLVIDALNTPGQPAIRRAAIATLRQALARGEAVSTRLTAELGKSVSDAEEGAMMESLIRGYVGPDLADEQVRGLLLRALEHPDVGMRELALDNLMRATNRGDSLGYNPDEPAARGLQAWRELLQPRARPR